MKTAKEILLKNMDTEIGFKPQTGVIAAMQEYALLVAFEFQKFRKNRLGFAFTDERLKAEFDEFMKTL